MTERLRSWQRRDRLSREYKLPSCGWLYGDLLQTGEVVMQSIRGEDEEIIAGAGEGVEAIPVLRDKLEQLVKTGKLPYYQLLFSDWVALLFNAFSFWYGSEMNFSVTCPHCKKFPDEAYLVDLVQLPCTVYDDLAGITKKDLVEPFTTPKLPPWDDIITFRLLRLQDMIDAESYQRKAQKVGKKGAFMGSYAMAKHILGVNGEEVTLFEALDWVRNGTTGTTLVALRREFAKVEPGYETFITLVCSRPGCHAEFQVRIPEDGSFFRTEASLTRESARAALLDDELRSRRTELPGLGGDGTVAETGLRAADEQTPEGEGPSPEGSRSESESKT